MKPPAFILLASSLIAPAAAAQAPPPLPPAVAALRPGVVVRATFPGGRRLTGEYALVDGGRIGIRGFAAGVDTLRLPELATLSYRRRHTGTGAIVGGIAGAGFGVFVALVASAMCEGGDDCSGARPYLIAVPLFGSGGALVGAAIGSAFPKWKRVFP